MIISGSFRKIEKRFFENTPNTDPETAKTLLRGKGSDDMHYYESALALQEETIAHRRFFHTNAEVGLHMPKTRAYILEELKKPAESYAPETGDKRPVALCIALLFLGGGAIILLTAAGRKRRKAAM